MAFAQRVQMSNMAWRMKVKLPVFKVTQRSLSGLVSRNIPRGKNTTSSSCGDDTSDPLVEAGTCEGDPFVSSSFIPMEPTLQSSGDSVGQNVSLYAVKQRASTAAWAQIRLVLLNTAVESSAMPRNQSCIMCPEAAVGVCSVLRVFITAMSALVKHILQSIYFTLEKCGR